jgi:hypothetical protein
MKIHQYQLPPFIGGAKVQSQRAASYYSLISMFFMAFVAYPQIKTMYSWINIPIMIILLIAVIVIVIYIDYAFFMLSENSYNISQVWKAKNLTVRQLIYNELYMEEMSKQLGLTIDKDKINKLIEEKISEKQKIDCNKK